MSRMFGRHVAAAVTALCVTAISLAAQQNPQEHPGQYTQADVEAGSRLYSSQCQQCHGLNGDQITGIDLRRGLFRRSTSDEDLAKVITTGVAGTAMPPVSLPAPEGSPGIAFLPSGVPPPRAALKHRNARA